MTWTVLTKTFGHAACTAIVGLATAGYAQSGGAFTDFAGSWSGNGSITIANGETTGTERIRCKGKYTVDNGGNGLRQSLRCASDSYRFDLTSNVTANGKTVTGSWGEESRGVNGMLQGQISGNEISALVETNAFAATFDMSTRGNRQTINIASKGSIRAVSMMLTKGN